MIQKILLKILFNRKAIPLILIALFVLTLGASLIAIFFGTLQRFESLRKSVERDEKAMIITKEVGLINTLLNSPVKFYRGGILSKIKNSGLFREIGKITPSTFQVEAGIDLNLGIKTSLFFESLDAKFLEANISEFSWTEEDPYVPLILSADFVDLYNFGFSLAMGSPQIDPSNIDKIPMTLTLRGSDKTIRQKSPNCGNYESHSIHPGAS